MNGGQDQTAAWTRIRKSQQRRPFAVYAHTENLALMPLAVAALRRYLNSTGSTWLIMEVKAASQDTAERWKELLSQACSRAQTGYDTGAHDVYIICAVGLKYMLFSWDPANAGVSARELRINVAGETTRFPSQLKPTSGSSPHVPKLNVAGDPDQYQIDLGKVWSIDPRQIDVQGRVPKPFTALENFLVRTRKVGLSNPRRVLD